MLRLGLTAWFLLTTLFGPALCCCLNPGLIRPDDRSAQTARHSAARRCPLCHTESAPSPSDGSTPQPLPNCPNCPFRDGPDRPSVTASTAPTLADRLADLRSWLDDAAAIVLAPALQPTGTVHVTPDDPTLPFLTTDDILRAHHVLRC